MPRKLNSQVILTTMGAASSTTSCPRDAVLQLRIDRQGHPPRDRRHLRHARSSRDDQAAGRPQDARLRASTLAGLSFGITDIRSPDSSRRSSMKARRRPTRSRRIPAWARSPIRSVTAQLIDMWGHARKQVTEDLMTGLQSDYRDETAARSQEEPRPRATSST